MLISPLGASKVEFIRYELGGALTLEQLSQTIYQSRRSRRRDRVAVMGDWETIEVFKAKLDAEYLEPDRNYYWSGVQWRFQKGRKRILLGDYADWFQWYMRHQRFKAFHVVILIEPRIATSDKDWGGYLDGFLARVVHNIPLKVIVVETGRQTTANSPDSLYVQEALLAMLYGTRLSRDEIVEMAGRAFVPLGDGEALRKSLADEWLWERYHSRYELTERGEEFLQGMAPPKPSYGMRPVEVEPLFEPRKRSAARHTLPIPMLKELLLEDVREKGSVTAYDEWSSMSMKLESMAREEGSKIWDLFWGRDVPGDEATEALTPSPRLLRRILDGLVEEGQLERRTWFKEVGRPTFAYCLPGKVPFIEQRCGQCAFYEGFRRRCRIWSLLNMRIGHFPEQWGKYAPHNVSHFELYKMRNSSRISPHSSACLKFLDKKRDYLRKQIPAKCDICNQELPSQKFVVCGTCGTRYASLSRGVRVYTAYEHEFRARYRELSGREPQDDEEATRERYSGTIHQILEKQEYKEYRLGAGAESGNLTAVLFPGDNFLVREDRLVVSRAGWSNSIPLKGLTIFNYGRLTDKETEYLKTQGAIIKATGRYADVPAEKYLMRSELRGAFNQLGPQLTRSFALAMGQSAINATRRVATIARLREEFTWRILGDQDRFLKKEESSASQTELLTYEARIMKGYWACYDRALDAVFARFGPRKKSRFVREYVADPTGRAKGYTAVDAAINYLHQRRLFKCALTNAEVGLGWKTGDGFLHHRSENSRGMGLLLDLTDPLKFADREKLLQAFLNYRLNWRDFNMTRDRKAVTYYYPTLEALGILEAIGDEADNFPVVYGGSSIRLVEVYRLVAERLAQVLTDKSVESYEPFIFSPSDA